MSYALHFFSLPQQLGISPPSDPEAMANFISTHGRPIGEMEFAAGESHLFFEAVEQLLGMPIFGLLHGAVRGVRPTATSPEFGGLSRPAAEQAVQALDMVLGDAGSPTAENTSGTSQVALAAKFNFDPDEFLDTLSLLGALLEESLQDGGEPATVYA